MFAELIFMVVVVVMALDAVPENSKLEEDAGLPSARFSPCVFSAAAFSAVVVVVVIILGDRTFEYEVKSKFIP